MKRIFVVDDEPGIADTLGIILRHAGYEAKVFYNAQGALDAIDACCPDLVVSDVVMPGLNGVEMALLIREHHPACKVLLFSGNAATADHLGAVWSQGYDLELLSKPVHPLVLLTRIASLLDTPAC